MRCLFPVKSNRLNKWNRPSLRYRQRKTDGFYKLTQWDRPPLIHVTEIMNFVITYRGCPVAKTTNCCVLVWAKWLYRSSLEIASIATWGFCEQHSATLPGLIQFSFHLATGWTVQVSQVACLWLQQGCPCLSRRKVRNRWVVLWSF